MELAFLKPFIYDFIARFDSWRRSDQKLKKKFSKIRYFLRVPFIEIFPWAYFIYFFRSKYSSRVNLGTRVLFKAYIYHFPALFSSRRSKDPKLKNFFFQKNVFLESTYPRNLSLSFFHAYFSTKIYLESLSSGTGFFKAIYLWFYRHFWFLKEARPKIKKNIFKKKGISGEYPL